MNSELMERLYQEFGGVWPSQPEWREDVEVIVHLDGYFNPAVIVGGKCRFPGSYQDTFFNLDVWMVVCSKEEFEAYAKSREAEWVPAVGGQCEYLWDDGNAWRVGNIHCKYKEGFIVIDSEDETPNICRLRDMRPLKTEREELIDILDSCNQSSRVVADIILSAGYRKND